MIDAAEQDLPECELSLIYTGLSDLSSMCAEYLAMSSACAVLKSPSGT